MLARVFDSQQSLFHTVFNRSVENCHETFTIRLWSGQKLARELLVGARSCGTEFSGSHFFFL